MGKSFSFQLVAALGGLLDLTTSLDVGASTHVEVTLCQNSGAQGEGPLCAEAQLDKLNEFWSGYWLVGAYLNKPTAGEPPQLDLAKVSPLVAGPESPCLWHCSQLHIPN